MVISHSYVSLPEGTISLIFLGLVLRCLEAQCPKQMFGPEVLWQEPLSQPFRSCSGELGQAVAAGPMGTHLSWE